LPGIGTWLYSEPAVFGLCVYLQNADIYITG